MRNKPTPSSLGLTKNTCRDLYRRGGHVWFTIEHKGATWYSNGHVATDRVPGFKGAEEYIAVLRDPPKLPVDNLYSPFLYTYGEERTIGTTGVVKLTSKFSSQPVYIQTKYAELIRWMYPGHTIHGSGPKEVLEIQEKDSIVPCAYIMPMKA